MTIYEGVGVGGELRMRIDRTGVDAIQCQCRPVILLAPSIRGICHPDE